MNPLMQYFGVKAINKLFGLIGRRKKGRAMVKKSDNFQFHDIPPDVYLVTFCLSGMGTFSVLSFSGFSCYTVERPWIDNEKNISCVPPGIYPLRMRASAVVSKTTKRKYLEGWEICEVPGREWIMLHVANTAEDVEGCVGVGDTLGVVDNKWAVMNSMKTFDQFMRALPPGEHRIEIRRQLL
jgi:hypothetical protein